MTDFKKHPMGPRNLISRPMSDEVFRMRGVNAIHIAPYPHLCEAL